MSDNVEPRVPEFLVQIANICALADAWRSGQDHTTASGCLQGAHKASVKLVVWDNEVRRYRKLFGKRFKTLPPRRALHRRERDPTVWQRGVSLPNPLPKLIFQTLPTADIPVQVQKTTLYRGLQSIQTRLVEFKFERRKEIPRALLATKLCYNVGPHGWVKYPLKIHDAGCRKRIQQIVGRSPVRDEAGLDSGMGVFEVLEASTPFRKKRG